MPAQQDPDVIGVSKSVDEVGKVDVILKSALLIPTPRT